MTYALTFGGYTLPATFYVASAPTDRQVTITKLPRRDGARLQTAGQTHKKFTVQGGIVASSPGNLRPLLDALQAALASGPANFATESDRYYRNCYVQNYSDSYGGTGWNYIADCRFDVIAGDPFSYSTTTTTVPTTITGTPQTFSVTNSGTAPALPQIALTTSGTTLALTLTNTTTGQACTITGTVSSGAVIVIDGLNETVTIGGVDYTALFDGVFLSLANGTNSLTLTGANISNVTVSWQNRYY